MDAPANGCVGAMDVFCLGMDALANGWVGCVDVFTVWAVMHWPMDGLVALRLSWFGHDILANASTPPSSTAVPSTSYKLPPTLTSAHASNYYVLATSYYLLLLLLLLYFYFYFYYYYYYYYYYYSSCSYSYSYSYYYYYYY